MLLVGIGLLIMLYSTINFKRGFLMYIVYQIYALQSAEIVKLGGFSVTVGLLIPMFYVMLYIVHNPRCIRYIGGSSDPMPFRAPFIIIGISLFITCFTGVAGFGEELTRAISNYVQTYSMVFIMWRMLQSKEDFNYVIKGLTYVFLFAALFAYVEFLTQNNFIFGYKQVLTASGRIGRYTLENGRGYRIMSVFEHAIGAGMSMGLYSLFIFALSINYKDKIPNHKLAIVVAILCIPCVILCKMRSAILFFAIGVLSFISFDNLNKKKLYKFLLIFAVLGLVALPIFEENIDLILSFFNQDSQAEVGGSSLEMRIGQLEAISSLMQMSPIGGLGEKFADFVSNQYTTAALAYESIWFEQMAMHGIVGVIATVILVVYSVVIVPIRYRSKECFFVSLAYFATYTLSSTPSFRIVFYYFVLFYFIRRKTFLEDCEEYV